jgi:hypothetical protein
MTTLLSIVESPTHPDFSDLYRKLGINEVRVSSIRKAISTVKNTQPNVIVAEFFYGYGNNYAGVNISNLDVLLFSMQASSPDTRVIILADKSESKYVEKLNDIFPVHKVLQHPVPIVKLEEALSDI